MFHFLGWEREVFKLPWISANNGPIWWKQKSTQESARKQGEHKLDHQEKKLLLDYVRGTSQILTCESMHKDNMKEGSFSIALSLLLERGRYGKNKGPQLLLYPPIPRDEGEPRRTAIVGWPRKEKGETTFERVQEFLSKTKWLSSNCQREEANPLKFH